MQKLVHVWWVDGIKQFTLKKGSLGRSYLLFTSSRFSSSTKNVLDFRGVCEESNGVRRITHRNAKRLEAVRIRKQTHLLIDACTFMRC